MQFYARIKRTSTMWADWAGKKRLGGLVSGVQFSTHGLGFNYESDVLEADQVMALKANNMIELIVHAFGVSDLAMERPVETVPPSVAPATDEEIAEALGEATAALPPPVDPMRPVAPAVAAKSLPPMPQRGLPPMPLSHSAATMRLPNLPPKPAVKGKW